jgi:anti-sigma-K factor RskA
MTDDTETPETLAGEYALGTLALNERERAEALIERDPGFARMVRTWERRLGQLNAMAEPIEPPPETWARVQARIEGADASSVMLLPHPDQAARLAAERNVVDLTARLNRFRQMSAGLAAIAAVLLAAVVTAALRPDVLPNAFRPKPVEVVRVVERTVEKTVTPGRFVAVLQESASSPAFILTVDIANRTALVRRVSGGPPAGKSYELWLVSDRFPRPRSLGLIGTDEFSQPALAAFDPAIISGATYAVSLEPEGGSPDGNPTEVVFTAKLVESVPTSR